MVSEGFQEGEQERGVRRSVTGSSELSLLDYAGTGIDPEAFVAFARLIRPPLIEREGVFYLAAHFDEYVCSQWSERLDDPAEVQRLINRVHISTLFEHREIDRPEALRIATLLAEIWTAVFAEIGLRGEVCSETGRSIGVTLVATEAAESAAARTRARIGSAVGCDLIAHQDPAA